MWSKAEGLISPKLFNFYVNKLIEGPNSTYIGCYVSWTCINNITYADDLVLLSPSIGALTKLFHMYEEYAVAHRLRYNASKNEFMVFRAKDVRSPRIVCSVKKTELHVLSLAG